MLRAQSEVQSISGKLLILSHLWIFIQRYCMFMQHVAGLANGNGGGYEEASDECEGDGG